MNKIEEKINELITELGKQDEVIRYNQIEEELSKNEFVKDKIEKFKKLQQKMAIYETHHNKISEEIQNRYNELYNELLDIPIYSEYINLQEEINNILQQITSIIEEELNMK